jgi:predicted RNA-binding protein
LYYVRKSARNYTRQRSCFLKKGDQINHITSQNRHVMTSKYWIVVASKDHVMRGVCLGIAQAGNGKRSGLSRMRKGDMIVYYSPKEQLESTRTLHAFTAIGEIADEELFQIEESPDFKPFRRKVLYTKTGEVRIAPLIQDLTFIGNKKSWGYAFRFGLLEIPKEDFDRISEKFHASW